MQIVSQSIVYSYTEKKSFFFRLKRQEKQLYDYFIAELGTT